MINTSIVPRILMALLVAAYLVLAYFAFLLFYPFETIVVHNEPFPVKNAPITAGNVVIYTVDYCRYTDVDASVTRTLVGNVSISLGHNQSHFPRGCDKRDVADSVIPSFTPPGDYYIQIDSTYQINNLRAIEKHFRTATFHVIAAPTPQPQIIIQQNQPTSYTPPQQQPSKPAPHQVAIVPTPSPVVGSAPQQNTTPPNKPPTTSGPPPGGNSGGGNGDNPVKKVVNTVLEPVNGVLQGVEGLLAP